ncbi:MAG: transketolase [Spirochaetales bacterium]|nr:transketolase [Spirochaetales bacterium]
MPLHELNALLRMYKYMYMSRKCEDRLIELYRQGIVKGTVTSGEGNEAAIVGAVSTLNPETDVCNFMQRDFAGYLIWGVSIYHLFSHYIANKDSATQGKDGNVHHGIPERGLLPMVSHLGAMLPNVVGATYARRKQGKNSIGLAIIGDGGTSTGDFHESINIASVLGIPVLFFIENNQWAYSTPNSLQFKCSDLSLRSAGYGIKGKKIKATDVSLVCREVNDIVQEMRSTGEPFILQADTYRLSGHAAYDKAEYVPADELNTWKREDPVPMARSKIVSEGIQSESEMQNLEEKWDRKIDDESNRALQAEKINPSSIGWNVFAETKPDITLPPHSGENLTPVQAVNHALHHALAHDSNVFLIGEDIGYFGGPFKATKDLFKEFGRGQVIDMPLAESGFCGFAIGASEMGLRPVVEMQFSDFSTDAITQICVNAGTFFFRTGRRLPLTIRMPGGGGLSYGPFHSEDLEGLYGTFPGLKLVYPSVVEDYFSLLLGSIYDDNPVLFFENKFLHRRLRGNVTFTGEIERLEKARVHKAGDNLTILAYGAMFHEVIAAVQAVEKRLDASIEIIDPRILKPFDWDTLAESVTKTHRLLVVHESWGACSIGSWIISGILEKVFFELDAPPMLFTPPDTPVPFAPELEEVYRPGRESIAETIQRLLSM